MDLKSQAQQIRDFIKSYTKMWSEEIMNEYPQSILNYPSEWIELLTALSPDELFAVDSKIIVDKIKGSDFAQFMQKAKELSSLPEILDTTDIQLEDWAYNGVKKKKKHEIQKIASILKKIKTDTQFSHVIDIGGGVGHLSRILSHYHSIPTYCIDRNADFQKIGRERLLKYRKMKDSCDVSFVNMNFGDEKKTQADKSAETLKSIFTPEAFTLGLHTCGSLANILIQKSLENKTAGLLSFGCCYHGLNPNKDFPLSSYYKDSMYPRFTLYGLTLATRSHSAMSPADYKTKEQVKKYRYALHLFLMKYFKERDFSSVGECNIKMYWGPFAKYIRSKLLELSIDHDFSDEFFNLFYENQELQKELRAMWLCNIIRWQLGRVLEVYLLLDRAIYLGEKGYRVKIEQYFRETISPRNIGILAQKNIQTKQVSLP